MIFGQISQFAIEATVEPDLKPQSVVRGGVCVWCQGKMIGDVSNRHCPLFVSYQYFELLQHSINENELWQSDFDKMDEQEIYQFLVGKLYGVGGEGKHDLLDEDDGADDRFWQHQFPVNWGERDDSGGLWFIAQKGNEMLILNPVAENSSVDVYWLSTRSVLEAASLFCEWYEGQEDRLSRPSGL
jgi:hypothetical protein